MLIFGIDLQTIGSYRIVAMGKWIPPSRPAVLVINVSSARLW
jgi:hypothetical protein